MVLPSSPPPRPQAVWRRLATFPFRLGPAGDRLAPTPFGRLALLHALSSSGDALVTVALAGSVFVSVSLTAARSRTALGLVCTVLPFLVVGPLVGPWIDRFGGGRRLVVGIACLARAGACLAMVQVLPTLLLFPVAFFSLVCSKTYLVAEAALVPSAVNSDDDLVVANSRLALGSSAATSVTALVGAGIYHVAGSTPLLVLDAGVFTAAAVASRGLRPARPVPVGLRVAAGIGRPDGGAGPSGRAAPRLPPGGLVAAAIAMVSLRAMAGFVVALVVFAFRRQGAPIVWYGLVGVASVGGNLLGAASAPALRARIRETRLVPACALIVAAGAAVLSRVVVAERRPAAVALGVLVGVGASVAKLAFNAMVQREVPDVQRSGRIAIFETGFQLGWVLAALLPVLVALTLSTGFVVVAFATAAGAAGYAGAMAAARRNQLPRWWPDAHPHPGSPPAPTGSGSLDGVVPAPMDEAGASRDR